MLKNLPGNRKNVAREARGVNRSTNYPPADFADLGLQNGYGGVQEYANRTWNVLLLNIIHWQTADKGREKRVVTRFGGLAEEETA